jgi:hypothetical protein
MNKLAQCYLLLTRSFHVDAQDTDTAALAADLASEHVDWRQVLRLADKEHMTAALAAALHRRNLYKALPQPVQAALDRRYLMGGELNRLIKRQAEDVITALNDAGITPIVLKGGLHLFEASPEDLGSRVLRDLDFLVPEEGSQAAIDALRGCGYLPEGEQEDWTYHYRPMYHPNEIVGIELHVRPGEQRRFLGIEEAWAEAVPVTAPGLNFMALCPDHRIAHNVFHSEVQDFGHLLGSICLRQLYDLTKISSRFETDINWDAIDGRMKRHGLGAVFRARMHMAVALIGAPEPPIGVDTFGSRFHLRRSLAGLRWPRLASQAQWVAGVLGRLGPHHIDLLYDCGTSGALLQWYRVKHVWLNLQRGGNDIWPRLLKYGRRLQGGV